MKFDVADEGTHFVFAAHDIHGAIVFSIGHERIVMAVDEQGCVRLQAWIHGDAVVVGRFDEHETLPVLAVVCEVRAEPLEERSFEFKHLGNGVVGKDCAVGEVEADQRDAFVFEFGRADRLACEFSGGDEIDDAEFEYAEYAIHSFQRESPFLIEEVGDMCLSKSGTIGERESGKFSAFDLCEHVSSQVFLKSCHVHGV